MASLPPVRPSDAEALVPEAGDSACTIFGSFIQMLTQWHSWIAWSTNEDGTATQDFQTWIGTGGTSSLNAPGGVVATNDLTTKVTVTWNAVSGAAYYAVYRGTSDDTSLMTQLATNLTNRTYDDTTGTTDVTYWYAVRAYSGTQISEISTPDVGTKVTSSTPTNKEFPYAASEYTYLIPSGKTVLEIYAFGGGGNGGTNPSTWQIAGINYGIGGGGASGSFLHVTGITVVAGETWTVKVGKKTGSDPGTTFVYRGTSASTEYAYATPGGDGQAGWGSQLPPTAAPQSDPGQPPSSYGGSTLPTGTVDLSGGDSSVVGNAGTAYTGGAALSVAGLSAGAGGTGTSFHVFGSAQQGGGGYVKFVMT